MFDIGWTEILILAVVSLFVIGPKDIPKFLGYIGKIIAKIRGITTDFRETVDDAIKNSELEEVRKEISFTDPELSKNFNQILNPTNNDKKTEPPTVKDNNNKSSIKKEEKSSEQNDLKKETKESSEFAGPTDKLPTGLKHIREDSSEEEKVKSKSNEA